MNELLVGYARVSTEEQDLTAQRNALAALGVGADRIYADQGGHALMHERPELLVALVNDWLDRTRPDNERLAADSSGVTRKGNVCRSCPRRAVSGRTWASPVPVCHLPAAFTGTGAGERR